MSEGGVTHERQGCGAREDSNPQQGLKGVVRAKMINAIFDRTTDSRNDPLVFFRFLSPNP